mmetsp:Transcript_93937/g.184182  ORF Transcript_93937/g.184182 Transcript_93937/m.184182 type:complete len:255 (+) Transcript_93937:67-831(+)
MSGANREESDSSCESDLQLVEKNTFLSVVEVPAAGAISRSYSDSALLSHSGSSSQKPSSVYSSSSRASAVEGQGTGDARLQMIEIFTDTDEELGDDADPGAAGRSGEKPTPAQKMAILHAQGRCRPCIFQRGGKVQCKNGASCPHCHEYHQKKRGRRKAKDGADESSSSVNAPAASRAGAAASSSGTYAPASGSASGEAVPPPTTQNWVLSLASMLGSSGDGAQAGSRGADVKAAAANPPQTRRRGRQPNIMSL